MPVSEGSTARKREGDVFTAPAVDAGVDAQDDRVAVGLL